MSNLNCDEPKCPYCSHGNLTIAGEFNAGSRFSPHMFYEDAMGRGLQGPITGFIEEHYSLVQWQCDSCGAKSPRMTSAEAAFDTWCHPNGRLKP